MTFQDVIQWLCCEIDKQVTRRCLVIAYLERNDYFPAFSELIGNGFKIQYLLRSVYDRSANRY